MVCPITRSSVVVASVVSLSLAAAATTADDGRPATTLDTAVGDGGGYDRVGDTNEYW